MKLLIPIQEQNEYDSIISEHFGHCPVFAIFDTKTQELSFVPNTLDHSDQTKTPADQIEIWGIDMIITRGIGPKAQALFKKKQIAVKVITVETIKDAIEKFV